jgi:O-methyltransferase domain/Dimerisation domain
MARTAVWSTIKSSLSPNVLASENVIDMNGHLGGDASFNAPIREDGGARPVDVISRMAGGFSATQILNTAAKLAIADHLAKGPCSSTKLARAVNADPQALYRFLRMMVALELLVQERNDSFSLSSLGQLLRSDHPDSMRERIIYFGEINYPTAQAMFHSVKTGRPAFDHVFGVPLFQYFVQQPKIGAMFNQLMSDITNDHIPGIIAAYDFSCMRTIVDVGGGNGTLLTAILTANPHLNGILFDTPEVIADAHARQIRSSTTERVEMVAGDIFSARIPRHGDIYLLSNILHDWDDRSAGNILRNCRAAVRADSRLLLIEEIMPARVADSPGTIAIDFAMLLLAGGKERTEQEYRSLLDIAGFQLMRVIPLRTGSKRKENRGILECKPG